MFNLVLVSRLAKGRLPWQPILGAKSAEIGYTPSLLDLAFHNGQQEEKVDERINSAEVLSILCKKFSELWSSNSGAHGDGLGTIYAPNARNRRNAFHS